MSYSDYLKNIAISGGVKAFTSTAQDTALGTNTATPLVQNSAGRLIDSLGNTSAFTMNQGLMTVTGNTVGMLGDSLTYDTCYSPDNTLMITPQNQQLLVNTTPGFNDYSPFTWANAKAGGRARLIRVDGVVGDTTAQILARVGNIISASPAVCIVLAGKNDLLGIQSTYTSTQVQTVVNTAITNISSTVSALLGAGIRVILCTVFSLGVGHPSRSAAMSYGENLLNAWIRDYCRLTPCVWLADYAAFVNDTTLTLNAVKSGYMRTDNLHWAAIGARAAGEQALYPALIACLPVATDILPRLPSQTVSIYSSERNKVQNPFYTGTGGSAVPGTGTITGTIPANVAITNSGSPAVVSSIVARSDGFGNEHQTVITWTTSSDSVKIEQYPANAQFNVGDVIRAGCLISVSSATNLKGLEVYMFMTMGGTSYFVHANKLSSTSYDNTSFVDYMFLTPEWKVTGAITAMVLGIRPYANSSTGGLTLKASRALLEVTR